MVVDDIVEEERVIGLEVTSRVLKRREVGESTEGFKEFGGLVWLL